MLREEFKQEHVLNQTSENFDDDLKNLAEELSATVVLEACSGEMPGRILKAMPRRSTCVIYGCLTRQPILNIDVLSFMGNDQKLEAFLLDQYLASKNLLKLYGMLRSVKKELGEGLLTTVINKTFPYSQYKEAIDFYENNMSAGKVILVPHEEKE